MEINYDFFISYNHNDEEYAKWIAWILEEAEYKVFIQAWDFQPGNNIILQMQKGSTNARHTLALLSNNYMKSLFTQPEWAAAFAADPTGESRNLIPVLIEDIKLEGLLPQISYINLLEKDENEARQAILEGVQLKRAKPVTAPPFPGIIKKKDKSIEIIPENWFSFWLSKRIDEIEKNRHPLKVESGPKFALLLIPIESVTNPKQYEISDLNSTLSLKPFFTMGWDDKVNKDGFSTYTRSQSEGYYRSYVQAYRNGIIEAVDTGILRFNKEKKYIPISKFEKDIIEHTKKYLNYLQNLKVKLPVAISVCLFEVEGFSIPHAWSEEKINESTVLLPVKQINSWDEDIAKLLRPSFDFLWNHCGFEKSLNFDEDGNWREQRGF
ncbi:toll/interleukin-1 receptor domain-containing protein [Planomicrobium okeanokoites]|uniref:toll/interleukin-1 receptor domain-containing protein n=1 Tax=Planomicrobium okeanokoites TaxID=244 RepID=UPI0024937CEC|nr:toll/interleukin-1 receptor domain-containing protein [Planomicrobium okeanokoites]